MNTELSIPQSVQPKPTKTQVISALVERAKVLHAQREKEKKEKRKELIPLIEEEALKASKSKTPNVNIYAYNDINASHCDITVRHVRTPKLVKMLQEYKSLQEGYFDESGTKKEIRKKLDSTTTVVEQLLSNHGFIQAADQLLTSK